MSTQYDATPQNLFVFFMVQTEAIRGRVRNKFAPLAVGVGLASLFGYVAQAWVVQLMFLDCHQSGL